METSFDMFPEPKQPGPDLGGGGWIIIAIALALAIIILSGTLESKAAHAYTGRKAIVYTRGKVMLAENAPWVLGKTDCSERVWRMLQDLWPELKLTKWFHRDRAAVMAGWPWPALMSLDDAMFGDLLFANSEEYPVSKSPSVPLYKGGSNRPIRADFEINHVLLHWVRPETAVHASKKRGFSETNLRPYWRPRITVAIRPPY